MDMAAGLFDDEDVPDQPQGGGSGGSAQAEAEEGQDPALRRAPAKPDPEEVEKHFATHIPRRMWCPICAQATMEEDQHFRAEEDHKAGGLPMVCMDYKEVSKGTPPHVVLRLRGTGSTYGVRTLQKGSGDQWLVRRLVDWIDSRGIKDCELWVKSDGEPAIRALQRATRERRGEGRTCRTRHCTIPKPMG